MKIVEHIVQEYEMDVAEFTINHTQIISNNEFDFQMIFPVITRNEMLKKKYIKLQK